LSYIKEFITLADTMEYMVAAQKLSISQTSLSKHIMHLESELGVLLFNRTTRKMELSEFGAVLLPYARQVVSIEQEYTAVFAQQNR
jgi:LysR family transcriptional regulator, transcription activator of glutamate synthase operon